MRHYELMMIIDPTLTSEDQETLITEIETELQNEGVTIKDRQHPGERELAYKIRGSYKGYYLLYTLEKEEGDFVTITRDFNLKPSLWRFMFVKLDS